MKLYEGMFLVDSRKANRDWDSVEQHIVGILEKRGATIHRIERWAERKLAFPVKKQTRGVYVLVYFETPDEDGIITEIYRQVEISDTLIRALILRIKEIPPGEAEPAEEPEAAEAAEKTEADEEDTEVESEVAVSAADEGDESDKETEETA